MTLRVGRTVEPKPAVQLIMSALERRTAKGELTRNDLAAILEKVASLMEDASPDANPAPSQADVATGDDLADETLLELHPLPFPHELPGCSPAPGRFRTSSGDSIIR